MGNIREPLPSPCISHDGGHVAMLAYAGCPVETGFIYLTPPGLGYPNKAHSAK